VKLFILHPSFFEIFDFISSLINATIEAAAPVTGSEKILRANRITSRWGAISAGELVTFHTIMTPKVTKARKGQRGPTRIIVRN
jgi:hypothetical protein